MTIYPGQSSKGEDVVQITEGLKHLHKTTTERIQVDNGNEFISKALEMGL